MAQLDQDGDGKISKEEAPAPMQNFFDQIDTSGDGFLDQEEQAALRSRFQGRGGGGPPGDGGTDAPPPQ